MDNYSTQIFPQANPSEAEKPRLPKVAVIAGICLFVILIGAGVFLMLNKGDIQSLDNEAEPALEYFKEGSRLLSLDKLMDYGLTSEQYSKVCAAIESALDRGDKDSKYFDYIYDSFVTEKSSASEDSGLSEEERQAILAAISTNDHTVEKYGPEGETSTETHADKEQLSIITFQLISDTEKVYTVRFNAALGAKDLSVKVKDSEGNTL